MLDQEIQESGRRLIQMALQEDLQEVGDLTSQAVIPEAATAAVQIVSREQGVLCGAVLIADVLHAVEVQLNPVSLVEVRDVMVDGADLSPGSVVAELQGPVRTLLCAERTILNFMNHLSGIATLTAEFVKRAGDCGAVILDTRKTLPGFRALQKYAVRCGGGTNHRMGLFDGVMIKDNHLAARCGGSVAEAVAAARTYLSETGQQVALEVEVDTLEQLQDALAEKPDIVLLDNMPPARLKEAVALRDRQSAATLLEASGGITLETIACVAASGVDRISIGALTHSAQTLDIGFDWGPDK